jgi:hypothetical protein
MANIVNFRMAAHVALICVAGIVLANCAGTSRAVGTAYRPAPATFFTVYVRSGDTISQIAERYRVSEEDVIAMNYITNPDHILSGDQLYVPAYGVRNPPVIHPPCDRRSKRAKPRTNPIRHAPPLRLGARVKVPLPHRRHRQDFYGRYEAT